MGSPVTPCQMDATVGWPPDVFAVTDIILKRVRKPTVSSCPHGPPAMAPEPFPSWTEAIDEAARPRCCVMRRDRKEKARASRCGEGLPRRRVGRSFVCRMDANDGPRSSCTVTTACWLLTAFFDAAASGTLRDVAARQRLPSCYRLSPVSNTEKDYCCAVTETSSNRSLPPFFAISAMSPTIGA